MILILETQHFSLNFTILNLHKRRARKIRFSCLSFLLYDSNVTKYYWRQMNSISKSLILKDFGTFILISFNKTPKYTEFGAYDLHIFIK